MTIETEELVETVKATLAELNELYHAGKTDTVLELTNDPVNDLVVLRAWCHYRNKNFDDCVQELSRAEETQGSLALLAYLYSYAEGYKSEDKLIEIQPKIDKTNINGLNALIISSRSPDSNLDREVVLEKTTAAIAEIDPIEATVAAANLMHNTSRLYLMLERYDEALQYIDKAIESYGEDSNWHHRGAAHFWKSKIFEAQEKPNEAWGASELSLGCWEEQLAKELTNPEWKKRVEAAEQREQECHSGITF